MVDLDKDINCPEGVDLAVWERMCAYRRQKVESENLVRSLCCIVKFNDYACPVLSIIW